MVYGPVAVIVMTSVVMQCI